MKLILASQNVGKQDELKALLKDLSIELIVPQDFDQPLHISETGGDYAENAFIKARAYAEVYGQWTLGDDTGLEVDALDGAPGLLSARLVGSDGGDIDRRRYLLGLLSEYPRPWRARFVSVVALVSPQGDVELRRGECLGEIIPEERGERAFGYDSIFMVEGTTKTMAELTMEEKNRLSHRAIAVQAIRPEVERLVEKDST
jgi:XTP/dITP diphosphohydrolase